MAEVGNLKDVLSKQELEIFKDKILIALVQRSGGKVKLPISKIDNSGKLYLQLETDADSKTINLTVKKR